MATIPAVQDPLQGQQPQQGDDHTSSSPMIGTADEPQNNAGLSKDDQQKLIALARKYKDQWSQERLVVNQRASQNLEMFKGNSNIVFGPGTTSFFNTNDWIGSVAGNEGGQDDTSLFEGSRNFFQLLSIAFTSSLSPQLPKSKWIPDDADQLTDVATAKAAQVIIDKVQRDNHAMSMFKAQLFYLYNCGTAFRDTRFVVDADRGGTKTEPIFNNTETEIMPARMHCFNCGTDNDPQAVNAGCVNCNQQMGGDSFYPPVNGPMTVQTGTQQVPIGIVAQNVYSPLEVDVDPTAETIRQTPILNLEYEVHIAALRDAYPDMYSQIIASATSELSSNGSQDRIYRQQVYAQADSSYSTMSDQKPTLSKTWFQGWAFALDEDEKFAARMKDKFPSGCLLINTGPTFLSASPSDMNKRWTVARAHEKLGMFPPCPGDVVRPFQLDYDDCAAMLKDAMDRCWAGITLANNDLIDSKSFTGKAMLPGVLNPVKLKRTAAPGSTRLADALHQFTYALDIASAMEYLKAQVFNAQTFAGVQPQTYGGAGDPNVQTAAGQEQQLHTALGTMTTYWDNVKEEHAQADELAVMCAKANLTEDLQYAIEEKGSEFRNQYVRLDDLQGSVHAYSDIDQGLPVTAADLRNKLSELVQASGGNPLIEAMFEDPENQELAVDAIGIPGLVVPGGDMRTKTLQVIDQLLKSGPIPAIDPQTMLPTGQMNPTIMPNPLVDDFTISRAVVRQYLQKNYDVETKNPNGFKNVLAYLQAIAGAMTQQATTDEVGKAKVALAGHLASQPPPPPPQPKPQLSPAEQNFMDAIRKDASGAVQDLSDIAAKGPLGQGQSLVSQVSAAAKILDFAASAEQLAADKTAPPKGQ